MHKKADYDGDQSYERDFHPPMSMLWRGHPVQTMTSPKESSAVRTTGWPTDRLKHMKEDEYDGLQL